MDSWYSSPIMENRMDVENFLNKLDINNIESNDIKIASFDAGVVVYYYFSREI